MKKELIAWKVAALALALAALPSPGAAQSRLDLFSGASFEGPPTRLAELPPFEIVTEALPASPDGQRYLPITCSLVIETRGRPPKRVKGRYDVSILRLEPPSGAPESSWKATVQPIRRNKKFEYLGVGPSEVIIRSYTRFPEPPPHETLALTLAVVQFRYQKPARKKVTAASVDCFTGARR